MEFQVLGKEQHNNSMKSKTDELETNDPEEKGGTVEVKVEEGKTDG